MVAERLQGALLVLVNKSLSAERARPGEPAAMRAGAEHATATLSLGLEAVAKGDIDRAAAALASISLTRLHRVGYTLGARLARMARALAPRATTAEPPVPAMLTALTGQRPRYTRDLDVPPKAGVRPFESLADLRRVAEELTRLTVRIAIAEGLGVRLAGMQQVPEPRPHLDDHARTAMVRVLAGGELAARAVTVAELGQAAATLVHGALPVAARARAHRSAAYTSSTVPGCARHSSAVASTSAMVGTMRSNRNRPSRNACAAISLAAL